MDRHTARGLRLAAGLGAGLGLIGAALVVSLWPPVARPLSNAEIMDKARALGMQHVSDVPRNQISRAEPRPEPPPETRPETRPAPAATAVKPPEPRKVLTLVVWPTMPFLEVAQALHATGAIDDVDKFVARARERGMTTQVKYGPHVFTIGADYDRILDTLVSFPPPVKDQ